MKQILAVTASALAIAVAAGTNADAAEKCVWAQYGATINNCTTTTGFSADAYNRYDWAAQCDVTQSGTTKNVAFKGVAAFGRCVSASVGSSAGDVCAEVRGLGDSVNSSTDVCWCKMTVPFVSQWVALPEKSDYHCSQMCSSIFAASLYGSSGQYVESFRKSILTNFDN